MPTPLFRTFRHYSTRKEIEAAVVNEEDGIRITLRGAVFLTGVFLTDPRAPASGVAQVVTENCAIPSWATPTTSIKLEGVDRQGTYLWLVNMLDHIGFEPVTRWVRAKDRWGHL